MDTVHYLKLCEVKGLLRHNFDGSRCITHSVIQTWEWSSVPIITNKIVHFYTSLATSYNIAMNDPLYHAITYENYFSFFTATLPTPDISLRNTPDYQQLQLQLNTPEGYNSGRFILRYDCKFRGIGPIEVEYKSVSASSDRIVTRNRSCFVEGQISTVTVWFVHRKDISSQKTIVNATNGQGNN